MNISTQKNIRVVVRDMLTGREATDDRWDYYWWTSGNGSCDCNRELLFFRNTHNYGTCVGCKRFIVVSVDGELAPSEFNSGYPLELIRRAGILGSSS